jgi:hypothetical protein
MILYKSDETIFFEDGNEKYYPHKSNVDYSDEGGNQIAIVIRKQPGDIVHPIGSTIRRVYPASTVLDFNGDAYGTTVKDVINGVNRGQDTNWQDQHTDDVIVKFNKVANSTTLASAAAIGDKTVTLTSATGTAAGKYIVLFHPSSERFSTFHQVGAAAGAVITLDSEVDFAYPDGTFVDIADTNMAVDGSSTTQVFGLRGTGAPPGVDITFDMTRIIISCLTDSIVSLSKFASITALTHGLQLRQRNSRYKNIWNVKSNREIDAIFGTDWKPYAAVNPSQGQDGFTARLTFGGPEKIGVVKRLPIGTDVEILVQDDLTVNTGDIQLLEVYAEGHIVEQ